MIEALKERTFSYKQRWGEAAEPLNLVERSQKLVESLQIRDVIKEQDDAARKGVRERLNALYADHQERGLVRSGATLRVGIEVFEEEARAFVANVVGAVTQLARNMTAYDLVAEALEEFLTLLESELVRIVKKVEYENQDTGKSRGIARAAERLWGEKRASLIDGLENYRSEFVAALHDGSIVSIAPGTEQEPVAAQPGIEDPVTEPEIEAPVMEPGIEAPAVEEDQSDNAAPRCDEPAAEQHDAEEAGDGQAVEQARVAPDAGQGEADQSPATHRDEPVHADQPAAQQVATHEEHAMPLAHHWHDMWAEIAFQLWTGKLQPSSESDVAEAMADWFRHQRLGHHGTGVNECARRFWQKYLATLRITSRIENAIRNVRQEQGEAGYDWLAGSSDSGPFSAFANCEGETAGNGQAFRSVSIKPREDADGASGGDNPTDGDHQESAGSSRLVISARATQGASLTAPALNLD